MTVREDIITDLDDSLFDTDGLAETITYSSVSVRAQITFGEEWEEEAQAMVNRCKILVKVSDVTRPVNRDVVVIGSDTWYVEHIISGDGITWLIMLRQEERPTL